MCVHATWFLIQVLSLTFELMKQVRSADKLPHLPGAEVVNVRSCTPFTLVPELSWAPHACPGSALWSGHPLCTDTAPLKGFLMQKSSSEIPRLFYSLIREIYEMKWHRRHYLWPSLTFYKNISQHKFLYKDLQLLPTAFGPPFLETWLSETEILPKECLPAKQDAEGKLLLG